MRLYLVVLGVTQKSHNLSSTQSGYCPSYGVSSCLAPGITLHVALNTRASTVVLVDVELKYGIS
jgi:hypothetical protein